MTQDTRPNVSLNIADFDNLIKSLGSNILYEKAFMCPCIDKVTFSAYSNCPSCHGSGFFYEPPIKTEAIIQSAESVRRVEEFGLTNKDEISVTARFADRPAIYDNITLLKHVSTFIEPLTVFSADIRLVNGQSIAYTKYPILQVESAYVQAKGAKLIKLIAGQDFQYAQSRIIFANDYSDQIVSIRYKYTPKYAVKRLPRNSSVQKTMTYDLAEESQASYPVQIIAQAWHTVSLNSFLQ